MKLIWLKATQCNGESALEHGSRHEVLLEVKSERPTGEPAHFFKEK